MKYGDLIAFEQVDEIKESWLSASESEQARTTSAPT